MPLAAFGDDAPPTVSSPSVPDEVLQAREDVAQLNELAVEQAPPAIGNTCGRTLEIDGVGDTCVTPDGMLRVESEDGSSHTIHGMDAPPIGVAAYAPATQTRITSASASDITCVSTAERRYVLVYARPADVASRYGTIAPQLRAEAYKMSAFLDQESQSVDPAKGKHLRFQCEGGAPIVRNVSVPSLSGSGVNFEGVVSGLRDQGLEFNGAGSGVERYLVFIDAPSSGGAAGTGHVFISDSSASPGNQNNKGGLFAVEYRWAGGNGVPHWNTLLHEAAHTMGAVVTAAAHDTGGGHCNDGLDVMCYADGAPGSAYKDSSCSRMLFDCGRDDYFNPSPTGGSYLASHWNIAATYNGWLDHRSAIDTTAPTAPTDLVQTGASDHAVAVTWTPSTDDTAVASYTVSVRYPGADWRDVAVTSRRTATISDLDPVTSYEVSVLARDAAGNLSTRTSVAVATTDQPDTLAPSAPKVVKWRPVGKTVAFSWSEASDNVGVREFELRRLASSTDRAPRAAARPTRSTTVSISATGLKPGVAYQFEVIARDSAGNVSTGRRVTVKLVKDTVRPKTPPTLRVTKRGTTSATIAWGASTDNLAVTKYVVYQQVGTRWRTVATLGARNRVVNLRSLRARTNYTVRVAARDAAGNTSIPRTVVIRTR